MSALDRTVPSLPLGIVAPSYNLTRVTPGIIHIGLGGFHRAHLAKYTHDVMELDPSALYWGIIGTGLRSSDVALLQTLGRQNGLYTLIERDAHGETRALVGSIVGTIDASEDSGALLDAIGASSTRIVSLTVSEHGYHLDGATRKINLSDPAIRRDLDCPRRPRTMPGILVESFRRRRAANRPAFTALTCDNMPHNGKVLREAVLTMAGELDPSLSAWIGEHARFPSSMVDRITPVPTSEQIAAFSKENGLPDHAALFCETFRQWVIEDSFADGRPDWDLVGAQFVSDVAPYEAMKLRLLNASHLAIAGLGALCGYETVNATIGDPLIRRYMVRLMDSETGPTLAPVPGIDLSLYKATLLDRFANPAIQDAVRRINIDAPINLLLDPLRDRLAGAGTIDLLALGLASWCRRVRDDAQREPADRPMGKSEAQLQAVARITSDPAVFLSNEAIFGSVGRDPRLVSTVRSWLSSLEEMGMAATLEQASIAGYF